MAWLPDGNGGCTPCPELLTEAEAIRYVRLDAASKNPERTLRYYREKGLLRPTQIGRHLFYLRAELDEFLKRQTAVTKAGR